MDRAAPTSERLLGERQHSALSNHGHRCFARPPGRRDYRRSAVPATGRTATIDKCPTRGAVSDLSGLGVSTTLIEAQWSFQRIGGPAWSPPFDMYAAAEAMSRHLGFRR